MSIKWNFIFYTDEALIRLTRISPNNVLVTLNQSVSPTGIDVSIKCNYRPKIQPENRALYFPMHLIQ